jgi:flagellin FlaB
MPVNVKKINGEKGITGLETAIILIAFVIVASVLSYVVISAGLFSSQKAKEAVNSGLEQTGATIEIKSDVIAEMSAGSATPTSTPTGTPTGVVDEIYFTVGLVPGGNAVDLTDNPPPGTAGGSTPIATGTSTAVPNNYLIISYNDSSQQVPSLYWTMQMINKNNGDNMLDPGELAQITVYLDKSLYPSAMTNDLTAGTTFSLNITPPDGSELPVERTLPSRVSGIIDLH